MQSVDDLMKIIRQSIQSTQYAFLMTTDQTGLVNVRLMQPFPPEDDLTLWFGTSPRSRKTQDIRRDPRVTVAYHDAPGNAYITLQGQARIVDELEQRRTHWFTEWKLFWPDGPEGDDYALICFWPERIELMHFGENITPAPFGLVPAVLTRQGDEWIKAEAFRLA
jgi:general stress protein 26